MAFRQRQRIEAGRVVGVIGVEHMDRPVFCNAALAQPSQQPPEQRIRVIAMRVDHQHAAAVQDVLLDHVLDQVGLAGAGGADHVHVLAAADFVETEWHPAIIAPEHGPLHAMPYGRWNYSGTSAQFRMTAFKQRPFRSAQLIYPS